MRRFIRVLRSPLALLAIFGPGLITADAGNDAGGITTYAVAGASYGLTLLWVLPLITISLVVVQEACARMGAVTGKGLAALIRERFGVRWTLVVMVCFVVATLGQTLAEFAGIAAAGELFGIDRLIAVPAAAVFVFFLIVYGNYRLVERVFVLMTVFYLAYVVTAVMATKDWGPVALASITPHLSLDRGYLFLLITLIGTTVTSYMQFFVQSSVVEKGVTMRTFGRTRLDVVLSSIFADVIAFFIILTTAQTLNVAGIAIETAEDAARALAPIAGDHARLLFGLGLAGASLLAASVLPLSGSFAVAEAFGFEAGISRRFSEAPVFMSLYAALIAIGAAIVLIPGLPLISAIIASQFLEGVLLPVVLVFVAILSTDRHLLGKHANGRIGAVVQWTTAISLGTLSLVLLALTVL
jgi:NRAMP (natural resistance-associated macrophage protein)-like metal ion transporter